MDNLQNILKKHGPMLSGELVEILSDTEGTSIDVARQRLCRSSNPVRKIILGYKNNQSFVYLDEHLNSNKYWNTMKDSLKKSSKAYYALLNSTFFHYGFMKKSQLAAYGFSPVKKLTRHLLCSSVIENLQKNNLIKEIDEETFELNEKLFNQSNNYNRFKAIEIAKKHIMESFSNLVRNINFGSYNKGKYLHEKVELGKFQWGFSSPSYLIGLKKKISQKVFPGFIVADILIGGKVKEIDANFFLKKIEILQQQKIRPFIPFLICENIEDITFKKLKSHGIAIGFVGELFGSSYAKALQLLIETIANATKIINTNPEKFEELCEKISNLDDKYKNMKGDLFEFVVGYFYSRDHATIEIGKRIIEPDSHQPKEIDVFVKYSDELKVIECKAYNSPLNETKVNEWLTGNIPVIRSWILHQDDYKKKNLVFELWSTSGFDDNALKLLRKSSKKLRRYKISYYDRSSITKKFRESKDEKTINLLNNYFIT